MFEMRQYRPILKEISFYQIQTLVLLARHLYQMGMLSVSLLVGRMVRYYPSQLIQT